MDLLIYTLRTIAGAIITPPLVFVLVILAISLYLKNKKIVAMQKIILGDSVNSSIELTLSQLVLGIVAGTIGSIILSSVGVVFNQQSGIMYLFLISMLLMFIKPRLICFSYSGAILGGLSILIELLNKFIPGFEYGTIINIDILYLMMFVGILHIIEGILVMIDGDRGVIPVFTDRDGKILGGYAFKRYWVLPIAIMIALANNNQTLDYATLPIEMPNWWPLIKSTSIFAIISTSIITITPFYGVIGYSSITFTKGKKEKAISSGIHIMIYGVILTILAQLARLGIVGEIIVLVAAPIGHEFMLRLQKRSEEKINPKFVSDEEGLIILDVAPNSQLNKLGIKPGDKLLSINDKSIDSEAEIYAILRESLYNVILRVKESSGIIRDINFKHKKNYRLGILLVPRNVKQEEVLPINEDSFESVLDSFKDKTSNKEKISETDEKVDDDINNKKS